MHEKRVPKICKSPAASSLKMASFKIVCQTQEALLAHQIIDPFRFNLNEQKIAKAHFNPQSVLIPKI